MELTEEQVREIFTRQYRRVKPMLTDGFAVRFDKCAEEPWPGYVQAQRSRERILPHVTEGHFPEHLFTARAPNQTEEELKWMRDNFEHTTLPVYMDLDNTVVRGLHETNWNLSIEDEGIKEYVGSGVSEWGSLFAFVKHGLLSRKIADPMGVVAFLPKEIDTVEEQDEEGASVRRIAPDAVLLAEPMVVASHDVWGFAYDGWYLLRLPVCSDLNVGNRIERKGIICLLVDGVRVWRIEQFGRARDETFRVMEDYTHGIGDPPVIHMMGVPNVHHDTLVWTSPFSASAGLLNVALLTEHQLRASEAKLMFPVRVMVGDPCDHYEPKTAARCVGGMLTWDEGGAVKEIKCHKCGGTGMRTRISPFGDLIVNRSESSTRQDSVSPAEALTYAAPSTDTSRFMRTEVEHYIAQARSIMHLDAEAPMAGGDAKTATQSGLDAKARAAFVKPICDQLFVIFDFGIRCIGKMMKGGEWDGYSLRVPVEYDLRTDADFITALADLKRGGLPPVMAEMVTAEFIGARFADDPAMQSGMLALLMADRLSAMDATALASEIASGRAAPWETMLHYGGMALLHEAMADDAFAGLDTLGKAERLKAMAQQLAADQEALSPILRGLRDAIEQ